MDARSETGVRTTSDPAKRSRDDISSKNEEPQTEAPRAKRQRVSRACDQCRAGREKCDGLKPSCQTCAASERSCTYATQAKKRGIQPGYIRTLELSLAWLFAHYPNAEATFKKELAIENGNVQKLLAGKSSVESDRMHSQWSKSIICKQIDQLLSGAEVISPSNYEADDGPDDVDVVPPNVPVHEETLPAPHGSVAYPQSYSETYPYLTTGSYASPNYHLTPSAFTTTHSFYLPSDFWKLLDVYYAFTHAWLPISEKHDALKTAYSYPPEGVQLQATTVNAGNHAELWAIIALTAHQTSPRKPQDEIDQYIRNARRLIPSESGPFEIGHLRAVLLLTLVHIGRVEWTPAWILIGFAVRIAYDLGLHIRSDQRDMRHRHVFLACFIIESMVSVALARPMHIKPVHISALGLLNEDGLEEWNPWDGGASLSMPSHLPPSRVPAKSLSIFNQLVRLMQDQVGTTLPAQVDSNLPGTRNPDRSQTKSARNHSIEGVSSGFGGRPGFDERRSSFHQQQQSSRNGQARGFEPVVWTPQHLHLQITSLWLQTKRNGLYGSDLEPSVVEGLESYVRRFGLATLPPSVVPMLKDLALATNAGTGNLALKDFATAISQTWSVSQKVNYVSSGGRGDGISAMPYASPQGTATDMPRPMPQRRTTNNSIHTADTVYQTGPMNTTNSTSMASQYRPLIREVNTIQPTGQIPHIGIPIDMESGLNSSPMSQHIQHPISTNTTAKMDYSTTSQNDNQTSDLDAIFEEIATLDAVRRNEDQPQFMRNLGLGPDLDLTAFFGADYQPSDPLLTYFQTDAFDPSAINKDNMFDGG